MKSDSDLAKEIREIYAEGIPPSIRQLMQRLGYATEGATRYRIKDIIVELGLPMPLGRPGYAKSLPIRPGRLRYLHVWEGAEP